MKTTIPILLFACFSLHAQDADIARMLDAKLNISQRNDACYALRGARSPEAIAAFSQALEIPMVRACAVRNLREAGAVVELKSAVDGTDPEIRAAAVRELGSLARPEFMELLAKTAHDPNLIVSTNAVQGLTYYQDRSVLPYLLNLAEGGGLAGTIALSRAVQFNDPAVLAVSRRLMSSRDVALRLAALRAIGDLGDASDLPALHVLAAKAETAAPAGRGFGLIPSLDLSRAAQNAIRQIEKRT